MSKGRLGWTLVAAALAAPAAAQIPDRFTNLKVLSEDIAKPQLVALMREYATALGVRCNHCHVGESATSLEGFDFAADDKEPKRVAREMMRMVRAINREHLPRTGRKELTEVGCVTCHRGLTDPRSLLEILRVEVAQKGVEAALARYRELRAEHLEDGAYDFGERTLSGLAETLARERRDLAGAVAVTRVRVELHPRSTFAHHALGELLLELGERDAALASFRKAVEVDPENRFAREWIRSLTPTEGESEP